MKNFLLSLALASFIIGVCGCTKDEDKKPLLPSCLPKISYGSSFGKLDSTMRAFKYEYDTKQRPITVTVINGDKIEQKHTVEYDSEGRVSRVVNNMLIFGKQVSYELSYNSKGQLESIIHPIKELKYIYDYDDAGNCISLNIYKNGIATSILRQRYEYIGNTIKETTETMSDPTKPDLTPHQIYIHEFYEQEDRTSYVKQLYFPSHFIDDRFVYILDQISYELGDMFYPIDPVYRFSKKMLKKTTTQSATQEYSDATADYTYEYTAEGFPTKRTARIDHNPLDFLSITTYNCK